MPVEQVVHQHNMLCGSHRCNSDGERIQATASGKAVQGAGWAELGGNEGREEG